MSVLAASPPFELQALALLRVYENLSGLGSGEDCYPKLDLRNDSLRLGKDAGMLRQQFERGPGIFLLTDRGVSVGKSPTLPPASQKCDGVTISPRKEKKEMIFWRYFLPLSW